MGTWFKHRGVLYNLELVIAVDLNDTIISFQYPILTNYGHPLTHQLYCNSDELKRLEELLGVEIGELLDGK